MGSLATATTPGPAKVALPKAQRSPTMSAQTRWVEFRRPGGGSRLAPGRSEGRYNTTTFGETFSVTIIMHIFHIFWMVVALTKP